MLAQRPVQLALCNNMPSRLILLKFRHTINTGLVPVHARLLIMVVSVPALSTINNVSTVRCQIKVHKVIFKAKTYAYFQHL